MHNTLLIQAMPDRMKHLNQVLEECRRSDNGNVCVWLRVKVKEKKLKWLKNWDLVMDTLLEYEWTLVV